MKLSTETQRERLLANALAGCAGLGPRLGLAHAPRVLHTRASARLVGVRIRDRRLARLHDESRPLTRRRG